MIVRTLDQTTHGSEAYIDSISLTSVQYLQTVQLYNIINASSASISSRPPSTPDGRRTAPHYTTGPNGSCSWRPTRPTTRLALAAVSHRRLSDDCRSDEAAPTRGDKSSQRRPRRSAVCLQQLQPMQQPCTVQYTHPQATVRPSLQRG